MHPVPLPKKKLYASPTLPHFRNSFTSSQLVKFSIQRRQFYAARAPSNKLNPVEIKSWMRQLPAKERLGPIEIVFKTALQYSVSWNVMETGSTSHDIAWNALLILHRSRSTFWLDWEPPASGWRDKRTFSKPCYESPVAPTRNSCQRRKLDILPTRGSCFVVAFFPIYLLRKSDFSLPSACWLRPEENTWHFRGACPRYSCFQVLGCVQK